MIRSDPAASSPATGAAGAYERCRCRLPLGLRLVYDEVDEFFDGLNPTVGDVAGRRRVLALPRRVGRVPEDHVAPHVDDLDGDSDADLVREDLGRPAGLSGPVVPGEVFEANDAAPDDCVSILTTRESHAQPVGQLFEERAEDLLLEFELGGL